jgi:DUF1680 family protein
LQLPVLFAVQLWQYTGKPEYLEDAQHIYYNGICHTQRANGGFGCDNCPGPKDLSLKIKTQEAFWCCTMRGGEGLARAIDYAYFTNSNSLIVTSLENNKATFTIDSKEYKIQQTSTYPFGTKSEMVITPVKGSKTFKLKIFAPSWTSNPQVRVNGKKTVFTKENGMIILSLKPSKETRIEYSFDMSAGIRPSINPENTQDGVFAFEYGPLMLGYDGTEISFSSKPQLTRIDQRHWKVLDGSKSVVLSPVYHLMDEMVKDKSYQKQILFKK